MSGRTKGTQSCLGRLWNDRTENVNNRFDEYPISQSDCRIYEKYWTEGISEQKVERTAILKGGRAMNIIEKLEARNGAMKVGELCELLGVDDKHIYRMAARGSMPSFHVGSAVRFDPQEVAKWLRSQYGIDCSEARILPQGIRPAQGHERRIA